MLGDIMKSVGIIAEYNPFHNGHQYHIQQSKNLTGADAAVVLMSGHFTQRGLPAVADKWQRAKWAIQGGADLVFELPFVYAVRSAELFAKGGISILHRLGVDFLSFGSEIGNLSPLSSTAQILAEEPADFRQLLIERLDAGLSFPAARQAALQDYLGDSVPLNSPNDILAVEYLKWIYRLNSSIKPVTFQRIGTQYHDTESAGKFASANYLRTLLYQGNDISSFVPQTITGSLPCMLTFENLILCSLRQLKKPEIVQLCDVSEGLENRIKTAANQPDYKHVIDSIKSKRYTHTRIARILLYCLFRFPKDAPQANYVRLLAANTTGCTLLRKMKQNSEIEIITSLNRKCTDLPAMEYDILAGDLYSLLQIDPQKRTGGKEFTTSALIFDSPLQVE